MSSVWIISMCVCDKDKPLFFIVYFPLQADKQQIAKSPSFFDCNSVVCVTCNCKKRRREKKVKDFLKTCSSD